VKPARAIIDLTYLFLYCQVFTMEDDKFGLFVNVEFDCDSSYKQ